MSLGFKRNSFYKMDRLLIDRCVPLSCEGINCCKDDTTCAMTTSECRQLDIGATCYGNYECKSSCCNDKTCQSSSQCKVKELGMIAFFAVFILASIIILGIGLYFQAKHRRRRGQMRRPRVPRIREIIAEGQILEVHKPPIHTVALDDSRSPFQASDNQTENQSPYLKKLAPAKTSDGLENVVWRTRANSRTRQPVLTSQPQELKNFDPFVYSRSTTIRKTIEEGREIKPESVQEDISEFDARP